MELSELKLSALEGLVNELLKAVPEEEKIKSFMRAAGLNDPKDPLGRIQAVLDALQFEQAGTEFQE